MFPGPAVLWGSTARLQRKELLQSCRQGHERCGGHQSPPYQQLPLYGSLPGSTGHHHAPTGPFLWSHQWRDQSPIFRHQQTCCSNPGGPIWRLMNGHQHENTQSCQGVINKLRGGLTAWRGAAQTVQVDFTWVLHQCYPGLYRWPADLGLESDNKPAEAKSLCFPAEKKKSTHPSWWNWTSEGCCHHSFTQNEEMSNCRKHLFGRVAAALYTYVTTE